MRIFLFCFVFLNFISSFGRRAVVLKVGVRLCSTVGFISPLGIRHKLSLALFIFPLKKKLMIMVQRGGGGAGENRGWGLKSALIMMKKNRIKWKKKRMITLAWIFQTCMLRIS